MIYNTSDSVVQELKYGGLKFYIHNRNLEPSEELPLGYSKIINKESIGRVENDYIVVSQYPTLFELEWNFVFNDKELDNFLSLMTKYFEDIKIVLSNCIKIHSNNNPNMEKLILIDNKIKDYYTRNYAKYSIYITEFGPIKNFGIILNKINIKAVGEREEYYNE